MTPTQDIVLLYFERACPQGTLSGMPANESYEVHWYDPRSGRWLEVEARGNPIPVAADGTLRLPQFPGGKSTAETDWALKLRYPPEG
jgi:hypothetical protein